VDFHTGLTVPHYFLRFCFYSTSFWNKRNTYVVTIFLSVPTLLHHTRLHGVVLSYLSTRAAWNLPFFFLEQGSLTGYMAWGELFKGSVLIHVPRLACEYALQKNYLFEMFPPVTARFWLHVVKQTRCRGLHVNNNRSIFAAVYVHFARISIVKEQSIYRH
jgi:hypothetical protein